MGPYFEKRVFVDIIKIETGSPCVIWVINSMTIAFRRDGRGEDTDRKEERPCEDRGRDRSYGAMSH